MWIALAALLVAIILIWLYRPRQREVVRIEVRIVPIGLWELLRWIRDEGGGENMAQLNVGQKGVGAIAAFDKDNNPVDLSTIAGTVFAWTVPDTTQVSIDNPAAQNPVFTGLVAETGMTISAAVTFPSGKSVSGTVTLDVIAAPQPGDQVDHLAVTITAQ